MKKAVKKSKIPMGNPGLHRDEVVRPKVTKVPKKQKGQ
jgi:hypothetical protein